MSTKSNRKKSTRRTGLVIVSVAVLCIAACTVTIDDSGVSSSFTIGGKTVAVSLGESGIFVAIADVPVRTVSGVTLFEQEPSDQPLAAVISLRPESVRILPPTSAKITDAASQLSGTSGTLRIRIVVGETSLISPFETGQDLGTIEVAVTDGKVTSVRPQLPIPNFVLTDKLNEVFSLGLEMISSFTGTIEIEELDIEFGMAEDDPNAPTERQACCFALNGPHQCLDIGFIGSLLTADDCARSFSGIAQPIGTTCEQAPCSSPQACCFGDGECAQITLDDCIDRAGTPLGADTDCAAAECPNLEPLDPEDCKSNGICETRCPDVEPDPDCSNAEICSAKKFCCPSDLVCDIQRCNELDPECTNFLFCDRLGGCCNDDDVCHTEIDGRECPQADQDCAFCGNDDEVCILGCVPSDPDCTNTDACPQDNRCEVECAGEDPDCALCVADALGTCVADCDPPDPDCFVVTNITAEGTPFASSVFSDSFLSIRATDGVSGTNWFSDGRGGGGPDPNSESFTWVRNLSGDTSITRIETDPETFAGGFGFLLVQVLVLNAADATVFDSGFLTMTASQVDLNVSLPEGLTGNKVILTLVTHESAACGGFSEFRVFGLRD